MPRPRANGANGAIPAPTKKTFNPEDLPRKLTDSRAVFEALRPTLDTTDPATMFPLKGNLQLAALTALGVAMLVRDPDVRAQFEKLAFDDLSTGFAANLDGLDDAASAALYASHRQRMVSGSRSEAKIPAALDQRSAELRARMFACVEHNLDDDAGVMRTLDAVRPGSGYLDRANDLLALADLYHDHRDDIAHDKKKFRDADEADARRAAGERVRERGVGERVGGLDWNDLQHRAWVHLATVYAEVRRWGTALWFHDDPDALFPDLVGASRAPWGSVRRADKPTPAAPAAPDHG